MSGALARHDEEVRSTLRGGRIAVSHGLSAFGSVFHRDAVKTARRLSAFDRKDDAFSTRETGSFTLRGRRLSWAIDVYADESFTLEAADPTDPDAVRILTVTLAP